MALAKVLTIRTQSVGLASGVFLLYSECPKVHDQASCSASGPDTGLRQGLSGQLERDTCESETANFSFSGSFLVPSSVASHSTAPRACGLGLHQFLAVKTWLFPLSLSH